MESSARTGGDGQTKELRLAIVCYGGSSLAVYMHGITKELHRLVKGSALADPKQGTASEHVYAELLGELAGRHEGVRTRVVVDVIAGTSAGGINGICLAKALAHNRSQDELRNLWFDHGDIDGLLNTPGWVKGRFPKFAWVAVHALKREPLKGHVMAQWVYDAFRNMDGQQPAPAGLTSLMPDRHKLELFVTVTDFFGYGRQVPFTDPNPIVDTRHRHVLAFRYGTDDGEDDFGEDSNGALTFAARTTSCIPGVFPPVSFADFGTWLGPTRPIDFDALERKYFRLYELAEFPPKETWFVDGGVLDNKPFGPAIEAIRERPADMEVDRRLLYLEPDPSDAQKAKQHAAPNTLTAAIGGLTGLPRAEPILDDLVEVGALNERVQRIADIVETSWQPIGDLVDKQMQVLSQIPTHAQSPELGQLRNDLDEAARREAGFNYATYLRLKISGVVDRYAETACDVCDLPPDSSHAQLARRVVRCWAEGEGLFEKDGVGPTGRQLDFLRDFDLDYTQRRLRFVIDGVSGWYKSVGQAGYPTRKQLDEVKARLWKAVLRLRDVMSGERFEQDVGVHYRACFPVDVMRAFMQQPEFDPAEYVTEHKAKLAMLEAELRTFLETELATFTNDLYADLVQLTQSWDDARKRAMLVRYLGFPFWDVLLYPVQALSDVGERDKVEVVRLSPRDTKRIPNPNAPNPKLVGAGQHHFGAFLSNRGGREKDYLWGRLDGAERLIGILLHGAPDAEQKRWFDEAARAILGEDEEALPNAGDLVEHVRTSIGA